MRGLSGREFLEIFKDQKHERYEEIKKWWDNMKNHKEE